MSRGSQTVEILVRADSAQAKAFAAALAGGFDKAGNAVEQMGNKGKKGFASMIGDADKFIGKLVSIQAAADLAMKAVKAVVQSEIDQRRGSVAPVARMDSAIRKFMGVTGMTSSRYGEAQSLIKGTGQTFSIPFDQSAALAEGAASAGVPLKTLQEGGLRAMAAGYVASGQVNTGDAGGYAKGVAMIASSMGVEQTPENIRDINQALFVAKSKGNVEISDLSEMSDRAGIMKEFGGMNPQDYLATMTMLSKRGGTAEMANSLKSVTMQVTTAGASKERTEALRKLGIKPSEVDAVGESMSDVFGRLSEGFKTVKPGDRKNLMAELFGEKANQSVPGLLEGFGEVAGFKKAMGDGRAFDDAVMLQSSGTAAQLRRIENKEMEADAAGGFTTEMSTRRVSAELKLKRARGEIGAIEQVGGEALNQLTGGGGTRVAAVENTAAMKELTAELRALRGQPLTVETKVPIEAPSQQPARGRQNSPIPFGAM